MTMTTYVQKGIREELSDMIYDISPTDTPFFSSVKKGAKPKNTVMQWQIDALADPSPTAIVEGSDASFTVPAATTVVKNITQIFARYIKVSDTADAVTTAGRKKELAYQIAKRSKELKRDIETDLTGNYASSLGSNFTGRRLGSIESWLETNTNRNTGGADGGYTTTGVTVAATDATSTRSFTEARLKSVIKSCWEQGGDPTLVMVGGANKQAASQFAGIATLYRETSGKNTARGVSIMGGADIYVSDFGEHRIMANRRSRPRSALVIDPEYWSVHFLEDFKVTELARTGHANKRMISCELSLCSKNEAASGIVADLSS